jgi:hypothetical protein
MSEVETAEGRTMKVQMAGDLRVAGSDPTEPSVLLGEALVPEGLRENLVSVGAFCDQNEDNEVKFSATKCVFMERGKEVLVAERSKGASTYETAFRVPTANRFSALEVTTRARKKKRKKEGQRAKLQENGATSQRSQRQRARETRRSSEPEPAAADSQEEKKAEILTDEPPAQQAPAGNVDQGGEEEAMQLHRRLDHLNLQEIRRMAKSGREQVSPECLNWLKGKTKFSCPDCGLGKNKKKPLKRKNEKKWMSKSKKARLKKLRRSKVKEVRMGMDLNGPNARAVGSYAGKRYALLLRSKKTRYSWLRFLTQKSADCVFETLSSLLPLVAATMRKNRRLVILTDLGKEWISEKVENLFASLGIEHRYTSRDSSLRNGIVERHFQTLEQSVATTTKQSGLTKGFWADLMETAHEVRLHTPSQSLPDGMTPFEQETGKDSSKYRANFQPVGCLAAALRVQRTSMGLRGEELVYLGPKPGTKDGMRLLNLKTRNITTDRSVVCAPNIFPCLLPKAQRQLARQQVLEQVDALGMLEEELTTTEPWWEKKGRELEDDNEAEPATAAAAEDTAQIQRDHRDRSAWEEEIEEEDEQPRPKRVTFKPNTFQPTLEDQTRRYLAMIKKGHRGTPRAFIARARAFVASTPSILDDDPVRWQEAMKHEHWRQAWDKELQMLWKMGAFEWTKAPPGAKIIGSQIVWKTKRDENNKIEKYKARGVARGDQQVYGDSYFDTFAPTIRIDTVRMLFTLAARRKWNMWQGDVHSAFLIPKLPDEEIIYMRPFATMAPPKGKEGYVLRLRRSLYGIKQAPMLWNKEMCDFLETQGYRASSDPCLFLKRGEDNKVESAVLFHVDDILCTGEDAKIKEFTEALKAKYAISDLGEPKLFLGIAIKKTKSGYTWSQEAYLERLLAKFNMEQARLKKTPIIDRLYKEEGGEQAEATKYRQLVGGLMYLMMCTRPDICFAINQLTRHFQDPQVHHWKAALRTLAYLKSTKSCGLVFEDILHNKNLKAYTRGVREHTDEEAQDVELLKAWSDADWAGDKQDRKSTTGYFLQLGSCVISYRCQKQAITATSSTTAELIALTLATKEVLWQKKLFQEVFDAEAGTVSIMEDNQGAKILADTNKFSHKTKHLPVKYFFCREKVKSKEISVEKVSTKDQLADIFTKALGPQIFIPMRKKLGVVDLLRRQHTSSELC